MEQIERNLTERLECKYAVIGLGILGSAVLKELQNEGEDDVIAIDKEENFGGATQNSFGMLRVFHDSEKLRDLALRSYFIAQRRGDVSLAAKRPFLSIRKNNSVLENNVDKLARAGLDVALWSRREVEKQYDLKLDADEVGVVENESYTFEPSTLLKSYRESLRPSVRFLQRTCVTRITECPYYAQICLEDGRCVRAQYVILAAGVGSLPLLVGRGHNIGVKEIRYSRQKAAANRLPQMLRAKTHEFYSYRNGMAYTRFEENTAFLRGIGLGQSEARVDYDLGAGVGQESYGWIGGSRRIFFMGAWNGNAFKLSWQLAKSTIEILSRTSQRPRGAVYDNALL